MISVELDPSFSFNSCSDVLSTLPFIHLRIHMLMWVPHHGCWTLIWSPITDHCCLLKAEGDENRASISYPPNPKTSQFKRHISAAQQLQPDRKHFIISGFFMFTSSSLKKNFADNLTPFLASSCLFTQPEIKWCSRTPTAGLPKDRSHNWPAEEGM